MTEAQKAQLRYIQLMKQSTEWQTDMAKTLMSPANATRILRQQFTLLARAIGNVLIPIVMTVIPYVMVLTQWLTKLANKLAKVLEKLFGIKLDFNYDREISGLGGIADGITDIGDAAGKSAKKLNTMLAPFDDLNVVQNELDKKGGGIGDLLGGGDLGVALPEYDALAGLTDKFRANMDKAEKNLKSILPLVGSIATAFALWKLSKSFLSQMGRFAKGGDIYKGISLLKSHPMIPITAAIIVETGALVTLGIKIKKNLSEPLYETIDVFGKGISKATTEKLTPLINQFMTLNKTIDGISLKGKIITDKDVNDIANNVNTIKNTIINLLDKEMSQQLANIKPLEKYMSSEQFDKVNTKITEFYDGQKQSISDYEQQINDIVQNRRNEGRALTEEDYNKINEIRRNMQKVGIENATKNSDEYYKIMARLNNNITTNTIENASEILKTSAKTRDKTIKDAEDQYSNILAEADKLKEAGLINDKEYKNMRDAADRTYRETVDKANKEYDEIYKKVEEKLPEISRYVDKETGKQRSTWSIFVDDIKGFMNKAEEVISKTVNKGIDSFKNFATFPFTLGSKLGEGLNNLIRIAGEKLTELKNKFTNWSAKLKTPHFDWRFDGMKTSGLLKKALETLNLPTSLPKLHVDWYEDGGYPTSGDLFFANENGVPEMVGRIGNKTAVANQDQITTSITNAVVQGLAQSGMNNQSKSPTTIYIGNKKVYEGYGDYIEGENDRYGTNTIRI